jgi:hypothetical protein
MSIRKFFVLLAAVCACGTLALSADRAIARSGLCAHAPGGDVVSAHHTSCKEAHKLMRLWVAGVRRDGRYTRNVAKWSCRHRIDRYEGDVMTCKKGTRQSVGWYVNLPS